MKISKDQAKEILMKQLKAYLDVDVDEKKFTTRIELRQDYENPQNSVWEIGWDYNDNTKSFHINGSVDGRDGKVLNLSSQEYIHSQERATIAKITEEQGKKMADEFVQKFHPEIYKQVKLVGDGALSYGPKRYYSTNYQFRYVQMVNGLAFEPNYISIDVDGIRGKISGFSHRWKEGLTFPAVKDVIGEEKAKALFEKEIKMELNYIPYRTEPYDYDRGIKTIKLVYSPTFTLGDQLDAKEGKMLDWSGRIQENRIEKNITEKQKEEIFKNGKKIETPAKEIDEKQASQIMKDHIKNIFGEGYELENLRYLENENYWESSGKKAWSGQFVKKEGGSRFNDMGQININALTGEMITIASHNWANMDEKFESKLTWEEGYDKAIESISEFFPQKIKEIKTEQMYIKYPNFFNGKEVEQRYYYYHFPRIVNGISYGEDSISVELDRKTGLIQSFRCMWNDEAKFPSTAGVIGQDKARATFFEDHGPKLVYTLFNSSKDPKNPAEEVRLVYRLNREMTYSPFTNVDAVTGEKVDYNGEIIRGKESSFKERVKGHWAEKEINILANQGIIDINQFDMDREITLLEAVKMMVNGKGYETYRLRGMEPLKFSTYKPEDSEYKYLQMAVHYGIMENKTMSFDGERKISREEMAELLIKLLRYEKLARAKGIYTLAFDDQGEVSPERLGAVALCTGLEIMGGRDGKIRPKDSATMVEMAVAVYKALENIQPGR